MSSLFFPFNFLQFSTAYLFLSFYYLISLFFSLNFILIFELHFCCVYLTMTIQVRWIYNANHQWEDEKNRRENRPQYSNIFAYNISLVYCHCIVNWNRFVAHIKENKLLIQSFASIVQRLCICYTVIYTL